MSASGTSKAALTHWSAPLAAQAERDAVAVLVYAPGFVRTAMTELVASSPDWVRLTRGQFQRVFDEGRDDSVERAVEAFIVLASGRADALTGRHISANDDVNVLIARAEETRRETCTSGSAGRRRAGECRIGTTG